MRQWTTSRTSREETTKTQSAHKDLPGLQSALCLAEEVGEGLGSSEVLLRSLQEKEATRGNTMMRQFIFVLAIWAEANRRFQAA